MARRKYGRVKVDFAKLEKIAAEVLQEHPLRGSAMEWKLSPKSSVHLCKNGTLTFSLIWQSGEGRMRLMETIRGVRLGAA